MNLISEKKKRLESALRARVMDWGRVLCSRKGRVSSFGWAERVWVEIREEGNKFLLEQPAP